MNHERLVKQMEFIVEIDKLKSILRHSRIMDGSRQENDAEHSWHLSVMAILLQEHANETQLDIVRVLKMLIIHDIAEIDAGDTFAYDTKGQVDKHERELAAAKRIFGLLPADQQKELDGLWQEFEQKSTSEAQYATALDRLMPLLHNYYTKGYAWKKHGVTSAQVLERNKHVAEGSTVLWDFAQAIVARAVQKGYLEK